MTNFCRWSRVIQARDWPLVIWALGSLWSLSHWRIGHSSPSFLRFATAEDFAENQMQFLRFAPQSPSFFFQVGFSRRGHAQEKLGFLRLLLAGADFVGELLFGNRFIRLAI